MGNEMMDLDQLAVYLQRDVREVVKLASRGYLPGHKVSGQWRFARAEINHWIETQLPDFTEQQLTALETKGAADSDHGAIVSALLPQDCVAIPLAASTRASVLRELVRLAERSWQVYDAPAILEAIRLREEMASTALESGVAIPHPRRPLPAALGESLVAYGRTASGVPFGEPHGHLTDIFFLVCCQDERTHLRVLARLSRLLLRPGFVSELRSAETAAQTWQLIHAAENELTGG
ncbi:MAG TPA: PTS sugar transporter subunit IIA [Gemmataceae bacterium]|jgi:PTS system nitrogen regulatory IIA component|nr:PTS sugar transporter subunit IIA [Gemmataceae bacterium]